MAALTDRECWSVGSLFQIGECLLSQTLTHIRHRTAEQRGFALKRSCFNPTYSSSLTQELLINHWNQTLQQLGGSDGIRIKPCFCSSLKPLGTCTCVPNKHNGTTKASGDPTNYMLNHAATLRTFFLFRMPKMLMIDNRCLCLISGRDCDEESIRWRNKRCNKITFFCKFKLWNFSMISGQKSPNAAFYNLLWYKSCSFNLINEF